MQPKSISRFPDYNTRILGFPLEFLKFREIISFYAIHSIQYIMGMNFSI